MTAVEMARRMMRDKGLIAEAEKMLGKKWDDMTQGERRFTAAALAGVSEWTKKS